MELGGLCRYRRCAPSTFTVFAVTLSYESQNRPVILGQQPGPDARIPLREIYPPEKHAHHEMHDLIVDRLTLKPVDHALVILRAVGSHPGFVEFDLSLVNTNLKRRVGHFIVLEMHPVFWSRQAPFSSKLLIRRSAWKGDERAEDGHSRGPTRYLLERAVSYSGRVIVQAKDE